MSVCFNITISGNVGSSHSLVFSGIMVVVGLDGDVSVDFFVFFGFLATAATEVAEALALSAVMITLLDADGDENVGIETVYKNILYINLCLYSFVGGLYI